MARPRGTGSLYQREGSAIWWIKYHRNGRSFRESTRTEDKRVATRILGNVLPKSAPTPSSGQRMSASQWANWLTISSAITA